MILLNKGTERMIFSIGDRIRRKVKYPFESSFNDDEAVVIDPTGPMSVYTIPRNFICLRWNSFDYQVDTIPFNCHTEHPDEYELVEYKYDPTQQGDTDDDV